MADESNVALLKAAMASRDDEEPRRKRSRDEDEPVSRADRAAGLAALFSDKAPIVVDPHATLDTDIAVEPGPDDLVDDAPDEEADGLTGR